MGTGRHTDRRTDRHDEVNSRFLQYYKGDKNINHIKENIFFRGRRG